MTIFDAGATFSVPQKTESYCETGSQLPVAPAAQNQYSSCAAQIWKRQQPSLIIQLSPVRNRLERCWNPQKNSSESWFCKTAVYLTSPISLQRLSQRRKHQGPLVKQEGDQLLQDTVGKADACMQQHLRSCTGQQNASPRRRPEWHTVYLHQAPNLHLSWEPETLLQQRNV